MKKIYRITVALTLIILAPGLRASESEAKSKNTISQEITYAPYVLEAMAGQQITQAEVADVLKTGLRTWDQEQNDAQRFAERKNKINPLKVVLDRNQVPNVVLAAFRDAANCTPYKRHRAPSKRNISLKRLTKTQGDC